MTGTYGDDYYKVDRSTAVLLKLLAQLPFALLGTVLFVGLFLAVLAWSALPDMSKYAWYLVDLVLVLIVLASPIYFAVWVAIVW